MTVTTSRAAGQRARTRPAGRKATPPEHAERADRAGQGKEARQSVPLRTHADIGSAAGRDPIGLLLGQARSRVAELVPVRHGRMLASPFAYYRGAALPMAADLASGASSGLQVQLCGDAHLSNFGAFASPERQLVFDVNDFDETLPGPFEWDVKRLAASFAIAAQVNGFSAGVRRRLVVAVGQTYREAMRAFAKQASLDVWYARLDVSRYLEENGSQLRPKGIRAATAMVTKAHSSDSRQAMAKLTELVDGHPRIINDPPMVVAVEDLFGDVQTDAVYDLIRTVLAKYRRSLQSDRQHLFDQFKLIQVARKVVGVGSVGTRAFVLLLDSGDGNEPLFLQAKEAQPSVLANYCGKSRYPNEGERVVAGQRLMQAQSDIFLGWTRVPGPDGIDRDFYVRQLRDWKASVPIELMRPQGMTVYAHMCAWTLARAHARSGDRVALAAYLGGSTVFDVAVADFAEAYAQQNERDYATFQAAAKDGQLEATTGV